MDTSSKRRGGMVTGLFYDRDSAERAYRTVSDRGYDTGDLNLVMSDETWQRYFRAPENMSAGLCGKEAEGADIGGTADDSLGAALAALAAAGASMTLPDPGLVVAGPLAAAGAGAARGGLLPDALIGWGIPPERVKRYGNGLKEGGILLGVQPHSEEDALHFEEQWRKHSGQQLYRRQN